MQTESRKNWGMAALQLLGVGASQRLDKSNDDEGNSKLPFGLRSQMLSEPQALMYRALVATVAADAVVFAKVRLSDFLFVSGGGDDLKYAIKMDRKFVDFLLCDPFSMQPLMVVELGIPNDDGERTRTRDPFITRALKTSGIKLLRVEARATYPVRKLRELLLPHIHQQRQASQGQTSPGQRPQSAATHNATTQRPAPDADRSPVNGAGNHPVENA